MSKFNPYALCKTTCASGLQNVFRVSKKLPKSKQDHHNQITSSTMELSSHRDFQHSHRRITRHTKQSPPNPLRFLPPNPSKRPSSLRPLHHRHPRAAQRIPPTPSRRTPRPTPPRSKNPCRSNLRPHKRSLQNPPIAPLTLPISLISPRYRCCGRRNCESGGSGAVDGGVGDEGVD
jgi:hypothetical protein